MLDLMSLRARRSAADVADNVFLSILGLRYLDAHLAGIAQNATGPLLLEHCALVADDGWLLVRGRADGREFMLRVPPDQWGWCSHSL